ncbi:MAG TPA: hypothetical protein PKB11_06085 [Desulfovibrio sp.]|jgi:hypothetical protein|uniref:hypothetical protein n=1 Tax=Desulfovibrio TaxID=872 RepID=UPI000419630B|nr:MULTISPECIES: hypothetical protein [Desulfovibrio]MDY0305417.1 hypothetical protein [Desulfovibrionaceae bacterium]HMM38311.1 hypothetical protein [Desulfovibrio sp.]
MQKIPLTLAKPGMKLAKAVTRDNGMVVMGAGMELTETHIERLRGMEVDRITVEGNPVEGADGVDTSAAKRLERLDHLFRRMSGDPWMDQVRGYLNEYFRLKAAEQAARAAAEGK